MTTTTGTKGRRDEGECRLSIVDSRMEPMAFAESKPAGEAVDVVIAPDGLVKSTKGDFLIDEEAFERINAAFEGQGNSLPFDYEHHTLGGAYAAPDGTARASGEIKTLKYKKGKGILASVIWTEKAQRMIRAREYLYSSPVIIMEDGKVVGLHSVGLTNKPAIVRMDRVAAKQMNELPAGQRTLTKETETMELLTQLQGLIGGPTDTAETIVNKVGELKKKAETADAPAKTVEMICKDLGLPANAGAEGIRTKLKLMQEATANSDKTVTRLAEVEKQLTEIRVNKLHAMLEEKVKVNAINPNDEAYKALKALAATNPDTFKVIVNSLIPKIEPGRTTPPEGGAAGKEDELLANSVKEHKGNYGEAIVALQRDLKKPYLEQGLTQKAANAACAAKYPKIFAA